MPVAADNQVIMQRDAKCVGSRLDFLGHGYIGGRRGRIARGVIVHQDQRRRVEFERALDYFARIDGV